MFVQCGTIGRHKPSGVRQSRHNLDHGGRGGYLNRTSSFYLPLTRYFWTSLGAMARKYGHRPIAASQRRQQRDNFKANTENPLCQIGNINLGKG